MSDAHGNGVKELQTILLTATVIDVYQDAGFMVEICCHDGSTAALITLPADVVWRPL